MCMDGGVWPPARKAYIALKGICCRMSGGQSSPAASQHGKGQFAWVGSGSIQCAQGLEEHPRYSFDLPSGLQMCKACTGGTCGSFAAYALCTSVYRMAGGTAPASAPPPPPRPTHVPPLNCSCCRTGCMAGCMPSHPTVHQHVWHASRGRVHACMQRRRIYIYSG
jgi:hypothetical protein